MSPSELILRILCAVFLPPFSIIGIKGVGCGSFLLLFLLTLLFYVPGQIAALVIVIQEYSRTNE